MTDLALSPQQIVREGDQPPSGPDPIRPPWLRSVTTAAVIGLHVLVFAILAYSAKPDAISLDSVSMDLVSEGDFFEQEEVAEADDTPPPEAVEEPDIAIPPPLVMAPDAVPLPAKKEDVDKVKKKVEQQQVQRAQQRQEAQARRRYGAPEGHAASSGASQATCLAHIAAALRRHTPGSTSLGSGHAHVTFHVNPGGGLSGVSASGSSPAHAALARRIVASSRGPSICGSAYVSQAFAFH
jgi:protein TonB